MEKQKTLSQRLIEFTRLTLEDNESRLGVYMVGIESENLVYGFHETEPLTALKRLSDKGYFGQALPFDVTPSRKNNIPNI